MIHPVVGLGNPGTDYVKTRHNAGFWVIQELADRLGLSFRQPLFSSFALAECPATGLTSLWPEFSYSPVDTLVLIKPLTFMNRAGEILPGLYDSWDRKGRQVAVPVVVVDQMDLPPGDLRFKSRGGTAGHNGLKSLAQVLAEDFYPLYFGIGRPPEGVAVIDHVLGVPQGDEAEAERKAVERACRGVALCLAKGIEAAMHEINRRPQ